MAAMLNWFSTKEDRYGDVALGVECAWPQFGVSALINSGTGRQGIGALTPNSQYTVSTGTPNK